MPIEFKTELKNRIMNKGNNLLLETELTGSHFSSFTLVDNGLFNEYVFLNNNGFASIDNNRNYLLNQSQNTYSITPKTGLLNGLPFLLHKKIQITETNISEPVICDIINGNCSIVMSLDKLTINIIDNNQVITEYDYTYNNTLIINVHDIIESVLITKNKGIILHLTVTDSLGVIKHVQTFERENVFQEISDFVPDVVIKSESLNYDKFNILYYKLEQPSTVINCYHFKLSQSGTIIKQYYSFNRIFSYIKGNIQQEDFGNYILTATQNNITVNNSFIISHVEKHDLIKEHDRLVFEVGYTNPESLFAKWSTTNSEDIKPNTIQITYNGEINVNNLENDNKESIELVTEQTPIIPTISKWIISGLTNSNLLIQKAFYFEWRWLTYYGSSPLEVLTPSEILLLAGKSLSKNHLYNCEGPGYKYIIMPKNYIYNMFMVDDNNNWSIPYTIINNNISIINEFGCETSYIVLRTVNFMNSTINIRM